MLTLVVLNYNDSETTEKFISSVVAYKILDKIIVVDNASSDNSYERLICLASDKVDVIRSEKNGGYGYGNNYGIQYALKKYNCDYVVISNPDVEVTEKTIIKCLEYLQQNTDYIIAAPIMHNIDNSVNYKCAWRVPTRTQYLLFSMPLTGRFFQKIYFSKLEIESSVAGIDVGCVAGSFLVVDMNKMGGSQLYDENIFLYCEETVLGLKTQRMNYKSVLLTDYFFIHHHSVSINKTIDSKLKQKKMMWKSRLYVLDNYYETDLLWKSFTRLIYRISVMENYWIEKITEIKRTKK